MEIRQLDKTVIEVDDEELQHIKDALELYHKALVRDKNLFEKEFVREGVTEEIIQKTIDVESLCQDFEIEGYEFS